MIQEPVILSTLLIFLRPRSQYERKTSENAGTRKEEGSGKKGKTKLQKHKGALVFDSVPQAILTDFLDTLHFFPLLLYPTYLRMQFLRPR